MVEEPETQKLSELLFLGFAQRQQGKTTVDGHLLDQSSPHQLEPVIIKVKSMTVFCRELLTFVAARRNCGTMKKKRLLKYQV